jgi:DNA helicase-2/ATP-dependent DNA helicase PcrA
LTLHRAKGLEFDAVFLPRVEERELPVRQAKTPEAVAEERRLLYVGLTRARRHLFVTWSGKPSRFLAELGVEKKPLAAERLSRVPEAELPSEVRALKAWRRERAKADEVPAYVVFHDSTLSSIAATKPTSLAELGRVSGVGPTKLERYGEEVLAVLWERRQEEVKHERGVAADAGAVAAGAGAGGPLR